MKEVKIKTNLKRKRKRSYSNTTKSYDTNRHSCKIMPNAEHHITT